jgi:CheY-like chemotaxis protein
MKILFLNPHLYDSPLLGTLRGLGVAAIVCSDLRESELVFKLHATSVSLFVGHDEAGSGMNEILKKNPRFARTPVILTTSKWTDQQCIEHQAGPFGANAYLRMPVDDKEFIHVIDQILGTELSHGKGFNLSDDLSAIAPLEPGDSLEIAPVEGGISLVAALPEDKTTLTPAGINLGPSVAVDAAPGETDGITLQMDLGAMAVSAAAEIQVEDAAAVYGLETPGNSETIDPDLIFKLESPSLDSENGGGESTGQTKEFRIEETLTGAPSVASEVLATPIEATSLDNLAPLDDDQPTRVATPILETPVHEELPSRREERPPTRGESPTAAVSEELDSESLAAMPYLSREGIGFQNPLAYREPMDDSVVPGGAATAPDAETLKKYLYLREQDVSALSAQLRQAREQIGLLEGQLKHERAVSSEFAHLAQEQDRRINGFEKEKSVALESAQKEYDDLKFEMKRRSEKIRVMELQVKEATEATERLKERVRNDIRKIRTREKELENRLEIMKKDSEALLAAREQKIIELKRKLDLMEFNMDLVQDLLEKERQSASGLREKLAKAAQMMRVAGGLLGPEEEAMLGLDKSADPDGAGVNEDDRTTAA